MRYVHVLRIMCWLAVLMLISIAASRFFENTIMADSILSRVEAQFWKEPRDLDVLFLGDSHSQNGLDPLRVANSFNFSSAGESYIQSYYKLRWLLDNDRKRFKVLVLQFDYHNFSSMYFKEADNVWYWKRYMDFFEAGRVLGQRPLYFAKWFRAHFASYFGEREAVLRLIRRAQKVQWRIEKGHIYAWGGETDPEEILRLKAAERADHHFQGRGLIDPGILYYFDRVLDLCRQRGIRVVLVRLPISRYYFDKVREYGAVDKVDLLTEEVRKKHPGVIFLDLHALYENDMTLYTDVDHLNPQGADRLTEYIRPLLSELVAGDGPAAGRGQRGG